MADHQRRVTFASPISERIEYPYDVDDVQPRRPIAIAHRGNNLMYEFVKKREELMYAELRFPLHQEEVEMFRVGFSHCIMEWAKQQNAQNLAETKELLQKKREKLMELRKRAMKGSKEQMELSECMDASPQEDAKLNVELNFSKSPLPGCSAFTTSAPSSSAMCSPVDFSTPNSVFNNAAESPAFRNWQQKKTPVSSRKLFNIQSLTESSINSETGSSFASSANPLCYPSLSNSSPTVNNNASTGETPVSIGFDSGAYTKLRRASAFGSPASSDESSSSNSSVINLLVSQTEDSASNESPAVINSIDYLLNGMDSLNLRE